MHYWPHLSLILLISFFFFFNDPATTEIYTLSLHDALPISPLNRPGLDVQVGDVVLAVNGQPVGGAVTPGEWLVNQADQEILLTIQRGDDAPRTIAVKALGSEQAARYRDWVEGNRRAVHEATDGKVGYIHIPDMGPEGYAEFHRGYLVES